MDCKIYPKLVKIGYRKFMIINKEALAVSLLCYCYLLEYLIIYCFERPKKLKKERKISRKQRIVQIKAELSVKLDQGKLTEV